MKPCPSQWGLLVADAMISSAFSPKRRFGKESSSKKLADLFRKIMVVLIGGGRGIFAIKVFCFEICCCLNFRLEAEEVFYASARLLTYPGARV